MRGDDNTKWLPAGRLVELLETLPADSRVMVNCVGNLLVRTADGKKNLAYVDFLFDGDVEPMDLPEGEHDDGHP